MLRNNKILRGDVRQSGFTLVELAIVLAVIGLIIGAVAIGKDVQRNAEYTKVKNRFIDQWEQAYNQYYQRTGVVVGDEQTAPRLMVNGAQYGDVTTDPTVSGGDMTGATPPNAVCRGSAGPGMDRDYSNTEDPDLRDLMLQAGVTMPPGRGEGMEDRYVYLDSNGNPQEVQVCFQWNNPGMSEGAGNAMVITGLTPDLARMLDQMIDGQADAARGRFRQQGVTPPAENGPGIQWVGDNTRAMGSDADADGSSQNMSDDQVMTVVAIYKMNQ